MLDIPLPSQLSPRLRLQILSREEVAPDQRVVPAGGDCYLQMTIGGKKAATLYLGSNLTAEEMARLAHLMAKVATMGFLARNPTEPSLPQIGGRR